jgi:hypothetical protein
MLSTSALNHTDSSFSSSPIIMTKQGSTNSSWNLHNKRRLTQVSCWMAAVPHDLHGHMGIHQAWSPILDQRAVVIAPSVRQAHAVHGRHVGTLLVAEAVRATSQHQRHIAARKAEAGLR